jgi:ATP-dependent helicase HrpA
MQVRTEKWKRDAARDTSRSKELAPFVAAARKFSAETAGVRGQMAGRPPRENAGLWEAREEFRWLVEEFRVSLFAQELGTAGPVSVVRLQKALEDAGGGSAVSGAASATEAAPRLKPATVAKKTTPLKSLGSLDQLFRK